MSHTVRVDLPQTFYDDHVGRDLDGGTEVKRLARKVRVDLDQDAYDEILSDAKHYAGGAMEDMYLDDFVTASAIIRSAKATAKALQAVERPAFPSICTHCGSPADAPDPTCPRCPPTERVACYRGQCTYIATDDNDLALHTKLCEYPAEKESCDMAKYVVKILRTETIHFEIEAQDKEDAEIRYLLDGDETDSRTERIEVLEVVLDQ